MLTEGAHDHPITTGGFKKQTALWFYQLQWHAAAIFQLQWSLMWLLKNGSTAHFDQRIFSSTFWLWIVFFNHRNIMINKKHALPAGGISALYTSWKDVQCLIPSCFFFAAGLCSKHCMSNKQQPRNQPWIYWANCSNPMLAMRKKTCNLWHTSIARKRSCVMLSLSWLTVGCS